MKKAVLRTALGAIVVLVVSAAAYASEFGCKVMLCMSSPGGPRQYEECRPVIDKLHRMLHKGKPYPVCTESQSEGVKMNYGYQSWEACEPGYEQATMESSQGPGGRQTVVCRKLRGYSEEIIDGRTEKVPVYDYYDAKLKAEPHYVEVVLNGEPQGERMYYNVDKK